MNTGNKDGSENVWVWAFLMLVVVCLICWT
jgi:hypothetical protein